MIALPIYVSLVIVALIVILLLARVGVRQDRIARNVTPRPGATSVLPALALVAAVLLPPLGAVLGHLSLYRIATGRATGRRLADWALIVGYVLIALELIALMVVAGTLRWF